MSLATIGTLDWYRLAPCRRTLPGRVFVAQWPHLKMLGQCDWICPGIWHFLHSLVRPSRQKREALWICFPHTTPVMIARLAMTGLVNSMRIEPSARMPGRVSQPRYWIRAPSPQLFCLRSSAATSAIVSGVSFIDFTGTWYATTPHDGSWTTEPGPNAFNHPVCLRRSSAPAALFASMATSPDGSFRAAMKVAPPAKAADLFWRAVVAI